MQTEIVFGKRTLKHKIRANLWKRNMRRARIKFSTPTALQSNVWRLVCVNQSLRCCRIGGFLFCQNFY